MHSAAPPDPHARVRRAAKRAAQRVVRGAAASRWSRGLLNAWYRRLDRPTAGRVRARFYGLAAHAFYSDGPHLRDGRWEVRFGGRPLLLPLTRGRAALDWETAVSVVGHEVPVKECYRRLLAAGEVGLFVDVGANYGTHSLLFLAHGVPTVTFEPNRACHAYFREACALNGFAPRLEAVALGERDGALRFTYPVAETWLGTADPAVAARFEGEVVSESVPVRRLDSFTSALSEGGGRALLKIDTEGFELHVLRGAEGFLRTCRPLVVFECWPGAENRSAVFDLLVTMNYRVGALLDDGAVGAPLDRAAFLTHDAMDFIASV